MKFSLALVIFTTLLLSGCESYQVITDQDPSVDLAHYNTFTWGKAPSVEIDNPSTRALATNATVAAGSTALTLDVQRLRRVSKEVLSNKGYLFVEANADIQVFVAAFSELRFQAKPVAPYFAYGRGWHPYSSFEETTWEPYEGQVYQIDLVDTVKAVVIWSGRVKSRVAEGESVEAKIQLIEKQIVTLLKDIPQKSGN
ncbi:MAG: DUF4136 domain-containing protein [Hahellaceae bacterium]|nr:DUF4136 domain-containing protein [Hahellaceae bacterium]MCP5211104.1 DUF4136 domain-containing protein [Hahellaceae bacterium]